MPSRKKVTQNTVVGVFYTRAEAEKAIDDLKRAGFSDGSIGMLARNEKGEVVHEKGGETMAEEGAAAGAIAGAGAGALVGAGIIAGVIPVIGPVLALGTLGTILVNAAGGAAIAGIAGALIGWGIPEEDAKYYEEQVKGGRFLVTVDAADRRDEAWAILHRMGGYNRTNPVAAEGTVGRTMQLKEEQLKVNKTNVHTGDVTVRKEVVTENRQVTVPVEREEVVVNWKPARGQAHGDVKAEEVRLPVSEERVNVTKETVATGEVEVGKRKVVENKTVSGTVRKEEVKVDQTGGARVKKSTKK